MKTTRIAAALLSAMLALPALAQMKMLEQGYEVSPSKVSLPASATGELTVQRCLSCAVLRLRATERSKYIISGQEVGLVEFKRYVEQNPPSMFVVMQLHNTNQLSRIVVDTER
jgi:hypothetical protein